MHQISVVILIIVGLLVIFYFGPFYKKEHADLAAPDFKDSLVDKYRGQIKDNKGMSLNDYALESAIVRSTPLSGDYRIL